jgi:UDP-N-acetylmuramyl pentapeptide synthase
MTLKAKPKIEPQQRHIGFEGRLSATDNGAAGSVADSRGDGRGRLFAPLRGERRDGHDAVARDWRLATARQAVADRRLG